MQFLAIQGGEDGRGAVAVICIDDIVAVECDDGKCRITLVRDGCKVEVQCPRTLEWLLGRLQAIDAEGGPKVYVLKPPA